MANTKLTALTEISVPNLEDLIYWVDDPSGTPVSDKATAKRAMALIASEPRGRLTTESGVPVSTADRTAQATLYFTPYKGNTIRIYDGTRWQLYAFTELSLALSGLTGGKNYDVFVYDNSGTLTLELSAAWTNDTTRADALTTQNGILVKSGALTRLYLGTIRATGATTTEDAGGGTTTQVGGQRFVWNYYNRVRRVLQVFDSTNSWAYATDTWRQAGGVAGNKVEFVIGWPEDATHAVLLGALAGNAIGGIGIGVDSITVPSTFKAISDAAASAITNSITAMYDALIATPGYHYLSWMEIASAALTFYGDNNTTRLQTGLSAHIMG